MHFVFNLLEMSERSECRFVHRSAGLELNVLAQQPQADAACADYVALIRCLFTGYKTKNRGLAGSVSAH
jgi:hypothetical protein